MVHRLCSWAALFVFWVAGLAGCAASPALDPAQQSELAAFPAGVGRGYPTALLPTSGGSELKPGSPAPDFVLQLEDGRYIRLSDLHGTPVVINFWATWCGPCRIEMPELMRSVAAEPNLLLLAVNLREPRAAVEPFAQSFEMVTPVVLDSEGKVADQFGVRGLPTTVFIDAEGRIQAIHAGIVTPPALADYLEKIVAAEEPL